MMNGDWGGGGAWMIVGGVMMIAFWALVFWAIVNRHPFRVGSDVDG